MSFHLYFAICITVIYLIITLDKYFMNIAKPKPIFFNSSTFDNVPFTVLIFVEKSV